MRKADLIGGIGFIAFALLMMLRIIPGETESGTTYGLSPYFYPTVMSAGILLCALGLVWQNWRRPSTDPERQRNDVADSPDGSGIEHAEELQIEEASTAVNPWRIAMFLLVMVIIVSGVWLIQTFGILIFGPILIAAIMVFLGETNWRIIVPTMFIPVGIVYSIVTYVLQSPLP